MQSSLIPCLSPHTQKEGAVGQSQTVSCSCALKLCCLQTLACVQPHRHLRSCEAQMHLIASWRPAAGQWHPGAPSPQSPGAQEPSAEGKGRTLLLCSHGHCPLLRPFVFRRFDEMQGYSGCSPASPQLWPPIGHTALVACSIALARRRVLRSLP